MIYYSAQTQKWEPYANVVNFTSSEGGPQEAYCNNIQDYVEMVKTYPYKFSNLVSKGITLTQEQQQRLDWLNSLEEVLTNNYESEVVLFVVHGAIPENTKSQFLLDVALNYSETTQSYLDSVRVKEAKESREEEVNRITVTTSLGNVFDGDEKSQDRMSRAITTLLPSETTTWVLSNNTPQEVTREELQEALRLAGAEQTRIWVKPYVLDNPYIKEESDATPS